MTTDDTDEPVRFHVEKLGFTGGVQTGGYSNSYRDGVRIMQGATRSSICVLSSRQPRALGTAGQGAASEWRVLFCADEAALKDLAGLLMS